MTLIIEMKDGTKETIYGVESITDAGEGQLKLVFPHVLGDVTLVVNMRNIESLKPKKTKVFRIRE